MFMCDRLWHRSFVCIDWLTDRMHQLMICCNFLVSKSLVPMWLNFHAGNNKTIHSTLEKYWAGLKTKVKTIDKLGEKITINTDRLYLLSLILCTLRLLLRNKPYGILNMKIEKICMSFVINSKAPFTNIMRKICESTWK